MKQRKIDDTKLIALINTGKLLQKEIAKELGVSEPAITKRLKKLFPERYEVPEVFKGLSEKEKGFVMEKAKGKNNIEAALVTFECGSRESAKAIGSQLMAKPEVKQSIEEIMNQAGLTKKYRISRLKDHIANKLDPHVSLKGLDMSFKLTGDYAPEKLLHAGIISQSIQVLQLRAKRSRMSNAKINPLEN